MKQLQPPPLPWMAEATPNKGPIPQQSNIAYYVSQAEGPLKDLGSFMVSTSPIVAAARSVRRQAGGSATGALGFDEWQRLGIVAGSLIVGIVFLTGALSYQAGKAMAPNRTSANSWGWVGVPVGLLTGPWGLGIMGVISNSKK